jgi:phosphomannomutase
VNLRQQLIDTGLFSETDTRDLVAESETEEAAPFTGEPVKVGHIVRLKFDPFGGLVEVRASNFDPVMRRMVEANRKARHASKAP